MATTFPKVTRSNILACQFSVWYPTFKHCAIRGTVIKELPVEFKEWLEEDGIIVPEGAEDRPIESTLSDDDDSSSSSAEEPTKKYAFPSLDVQIRSSIGQYDAVFPKLNFTSPRDASWILTTSQPLRCTSPSDVYLALKASDFVSHDLDEERVFEGCDETISSPSSSVEEAEREPYHLQLVLKKWYSVERNREMRCFVRDNILLGISQRDPNYYEFLTDPSTQSAIRSTAVTFFEENVKGKFPGGSNYIFDILLTRSLSSAHIIDINPYLPHTDPLLFNYDELFSLYQSSQTALGALPELRVIDSPTHPLASRNAPAHQHNMIPKDIIALSEGRGLDGFEEELRRAVEEQAKEEGEN